MRVTLESTTKTVTLVLPNGTEVPARIWEGTTANGIACHAYITRIAVQRDDDVAEFARDLNEQRHPSAALDVIPTRLVI
jgi:hypothetical protein